MAGPVSPATDTAFMRAALGLARRGLGTVAPNPSVGCIVVQNGQIVGRGWTQPGGRPHGETEALRRAGAAARGATAYVSLEPCNHYGKTPPCTEALIAAGVERVVVACEDPDPRVSGSGIRRLREAGIAVEVGLCADEARDLNEGFFRRIIDGRPMVTLKFATSLDGRIAVHTGESQWITGEAARTWSHGLRARYDAIMVGLNTALADDPELTCRLPGLNQRSPVRVVVDSRLRLPLTSRLVRTARSVSTLLIALQGADRMRSRAFQDCGVEVIEVPADQAGTIDVVAAAQALGERGITRLMVEGGAHLSASLLQRRLVDRIEWFRAPRLIGGDGIPALVSFGVDRLSDTADFIRIAVRQVGDDVMESYRRSF
jgi:diaminohydroxyphosphoribosylaminopyrimidine deaminase/5-amino-6-(5-phosphoribosylamino)uracil reductase